MFKILIVEDNATFRQLLKEILRNRFGSIEVMEASNGVEGLRKTESFGPHLIFMDIQLPGESGLTLTQKIKKERPEIRIVILTSYDLPEYREAAHQYGADFFVSKDSSTGKFLSLVESIVSGSEYPSPLPENQGRA
jgi:DNA-binding NarL/FixJ family response regulator